MSQMSIEDEVLLENEEELNELEYFGDEEKPIFESVRVTKKDFSIYELYRKYKKKQLILEVDFQRNEVWGPKQKCELIESILMGLPLPIFYFKQQNNSTYVVVDGKQILSTLFDFLSDGFPLKSLKILKFLNGKKFKDLVDELGIYQSQLEDYQVYSHVILPPTPDKILFDIFDRVNRGGTKLNKQEIRNALYHGRGLNMITEVVASQEFLQTTRIEYKKDRRMKGSYLVTRFLAFYLFFNDLLFKDGKKYEYTGNLDDLIETTLTKLNQSSLEELEEIRQVTIKSLEMARDILGKGAFRKENNESKPINMNIFETTLYFMTLLPKNNIAVSREELLEKMPPFLTGGEMISTVTREGATYAKLPHKFEAGTVNAAGAAGLAAAIRYVEKIGFDTIMAKEEALTKRAMEGLKKVPHLHILGDEAPENHTGIVAFTIEGVHPHDVSEILSSDGIDVRAGHHCAQPLLEYRGVHNATRASFMFYNTPEEVDAFVESTAQIRRRMGYGE